MSEQAANRGARWLTYLKERFPPPSFSVIAGGIAVSATALKGGSVLSVMAITLSFLGILLFFALVRLMDELKYYRRDQVAHPKRPIPRGLVPVEEARRMVISGVWAMIAYGIASIPVAGRVSAVLYLVMAVYLWLMYKEFYAGPSLAVSPLLYAVSHQIILLAVCAFAATSGRPQMLSDPEILYYGMAVLGSSLAYEVCRKLNPEAHPILRTYLQHYGRARATIIVFIALALAGVGALGLGLGPWLWSCEVIVAGSALYLFARPERHNVAYRLAMGSLIVHLWAPGVRWVWEKIAG